MFPHMGEHQLNPHLAQYNLGGRGKGKGRVGRWVFGRSSKEKAASTWAGVWAQA